VTATSLSKLWIPELYCLKTFNYIYHLYTVSLGSHFWSTSASPPLTSKQSHCCSPPLLFGQREDTHVLWIHAKRLSEFSSFVPPPWLFTHNYPKCTTSASMQWVITSYEVIHRQWVNSSLLSLSNLHMHWAIQLSAVSTRLKRSFKDLTELFKNNYWYSENENVLKWPTLQLLN